jgi:hypothetical protein
MKVGGRTSQYVCCDLESMYSHSPKQFAVVCNTKHYGKTLWKVTVHWGAVPRHFFCCRFFMGRCETPVKLLLNPHDKFFVWALYAMFLKKPLPARWMLHWKVLCRRFKGPGCPLEAISAKRLLGALKKLIQSVQWPIFPKRPVDASSKCLMGFSW